MPPAPANQPVDLPIRDGVVREVAAGSISRDRRSATPRPTSEGGVGHSVGVHRPSLEGPFGPGHLRPSEEGRSRTTNQQKRDVMVETGSLERLSASDLFILSWDDFDWSGDIGALAILDGTRLLDPDGRIQIEKIRQQLEPRLHLVPRFRQRLYRPRRGLGWPLWIDAPSFDLADHVRVHPLAPPGDQAQLLQACAELAGRRLDPARPLWEIWFLPGLSQGRVGLFVKLHHAFADGMSGVATFGALLDLTADAPSPVAPPWDRTPTPTPGELMHDNLRRRAQGLNQAWSSLTHPGSTLRQARHTWPAWREFFAEQRAPRTSLNRPIGADRRLAIVGSRLELIKQIAHTHQAKVNDVALAAVAGGLRQLLASRGEPVEQLALRAMVPISLHREQPGPARG